MNKGTKQAWISVTGIAFISVCVTGIVYNSMSQFQAPILAAFPEWGRAQFAVTSTIQMVVNCLMMLTIGKIINKFGVKMVAIIGSVCLVAFPAIGMVAESLPLFYLAYGLLGVAIGALSISLAPVLVNTWFARNQGAILGGINTAANLVGMVVSPLIAGWIASGGYKGGFRNELIILAVGLAVGCILIKNHPPKGVLPIGSNPSDTPADNSGELPGITAKEALRKPKFYLIWLAVFLMVGAFSTVMQLMNIYAVGDLGLSGTAASVILSVYCLVNALLQIPIGALCDRVGAKMSFLLGGGAFIVAAVMLLAMPGLPSWCMYVVGGLMGFCMIMSLVPVQMMIGEIYGPRDMGTIIGYVFTASTLGGAVLMPLFNYIYDAQGSYNLAWILGMVFVVAGIILIFAVSRKKEEN